MANPLANITTKLKKVPKIVWFIAGGILLAVIFLRTKGGGTGVVADGLVGGVGGGGGGGGGPAPAPAPPPTPAPTQPTTDLPAEVGATAPINEAFRQGIADAVNYGAPAASAAMAPARRATAPLSGQQAAFMIRDVELPFVTPKRPVATVRPTGRRATGPRPKSAPKPAPTLPKPTRRPTPKQTGRRGLIPV